MPTAPPRDPGSPQSSVSDPALDPAHWLDEEHRPAEGAPLPLGVPEGSLRSLPEVVEALEEKTDDETVLPGRRHLPRGVDPRRLDKAGWGLITPPDLDPAIREALEPLIEHRRRQAGELARLDLTAEPDTRAEDFLLGEGIGLGNAHPETMPHYLLLVGGPKDLSFRFQQGLDLDFAVGRLDFDTPEEYRRYAETVVAVERGERQAVHPRRMTFLGVHNPGDAATPLSTRQLIQPLARHFEGRRPDWTVRCHVAEEAHGARFREVLGGEETPALAFSASHGMNRAVDGGRFREQAGALLTQDWPGGGHPVGRDHIFTGDDLPPGPGPAGMMVFLFACHGAGMGETDDFDFWEKDDQGKLVGFAPGKPKKIAPEPLVARLPQRLLGHPEGGALAVIAHVDRAWGYSFLWGRGEQVRVYADTLGEILDGLPVGEAKKGFDARTGQLAGFLVAQLQRYFEKRPVDGAQLARLWTAHNDARNYVILGDPAARLAVDDGQGTGGPR